MHHVTHPYVQKEHTEYDKLKTTIKNLNPRKIKAFLDDYVVGQENAKKVLSVAIYNHYKRLLAETQQQEVEIDKSNILLIGETGTGKTLLAKTIARMLEVPFCIADATVLTEAGYVGEDVESVISRLLQVSDYDVKKTEQGIIFIDEIDKIARKSDNPSITRDVSGEGVQQGLLKLLEGSTIKVPPQGGRKHPDQKLVEINTKNILFICGGAFDGIEKIIKRRIQNVSLGFKNESSQSSKKTDEIISHIASEDIKTYGIIPELVGRLSVITHLSKLKKEDLIKILITPKNALLKQYKALFEMDGINFSFTKSALEKIAEQAIKTKLGARGLRIILEKILQTPMYELPGTDKKIYQLDPKKITEI